GQSSKPAGPYSSALMADDCAGLLEALNLENVRVVGCSMGSIIAQQLALRHPQKVRSLVLMCPWARCDNKAKSIFQHMKNCKAKLSPEEFSLYMQTLIYSKKSWDDEAFAAGLAEDRKQAAHDPALQPLAGLEGQAAACVDHDVLEQLHDIAAPVLVIGGEDDAFTPAWMAHEVAAAIPDSKLYLYKDSGHA